jgi:peptide/nickel transport system substrate-binding protein
MLRRRSLFATAAAQGVALALPSIAGSASERLLKFIPQADVTVIDPIWSTAYVSRNHGYMVFDTRSAWMATIRSSRRCWRAR